MNATGWNAVAVEAKKDKAKPPGQPTACIRKGQRTSYCGRDVDESQEFMFTDAGYAVKHYRNSKTIKACPDCITECERAGVGNTKYLAPMATREKENNK
jgi:hypothetical protein